MNIQLNSDALLLSRAGGGTGPMKPGNLLIKWINVVPIPAEILSLKDESIIK